MTKYRIETFERRTWFFRQRFGFRIVCVNNGQVVGQGEKYLRSSDRDDTVAALVASWPGVQVNTQRVNRLDL